MKSIFHIAHKSCILLMILFFTLTSANREPDKIIVIDKRPTPKKTERMFIIPVATNNEYSKEIGKQKKFEILIKQELDSLPKWIK